MLGNWCSEMPQPLNTVCPKSSPFFSPVARPQLVSPLFFLSVNSSIHAHSFFVHLCLLNAPCALGSALRGPDTAWDLMEHVIQEARAAPPLRLRSCQCLSLKHSGSFCLLPSVLFAAALGPCSQRMQTQDLCQD